MDLVHLWLLGGGANEKHGFLLMGNFPDNQLLERDYRRLVILSGERGRGRVRQTAEY